MNIKIVLLVVFFIAVILFVWNRKKKSDTIIYGSMGCPHTVKHVNKYPDAQFVDCTSQKCPDFVNAYPTTQWPDGKITVGT
jgi:hypothetical protein